MEKWFEFIKKSEDPELEGLVQIKDENTEFTAEYGEEFPIKIGNIEEDDMVSVVKVGLGCYEFDSDDPSDDRVKEVIDSEIRDRIEDLDLKED